MHHNAPTTHAQPKKCVFIPSENKKNDDDADLMEREKKGGLHFLDVDFCCSPPRFHQVLQCATYPKKSKGDFSIGMTKKKNEKRFFFFLSARRRRDADVTWEIPTGFFSPPHFFFSVLLLLLAGSFSFRCGTCIHNRNRPSSHK